MFRRILIPLDGSTFAESALPLGKAFGKGEDTTVELVTVCETLPGFAQPEWDSAAREWSEQYLNEVTRRMADSIGKTVESAILSGPVASALERRAAEGTDLVILATHGRGPISRAWLGSVADHFLRNAPCPVIMVRPEKKAEAPAEDTEPRISQILVPLDGSKFSEEVIEHAAELATFLRSSMTLLQVIVYPTEIASPYLPHTVQMNQEIVEQAKAEAHAHLEQVAGDLRARGLDVDVHIEVDTQAGHGILNAAELVNADLIAMATHGRGGVARTFLGSTADKVVRGTTGPILLVRPETDD